jgi:ribonucleoside-triphosphate reductase
MNTRSKVIKRDGREVYFDAEKIYLAVKKAFDSVGHIIPPKVYKDLESMISKLPNNVNVEYIQDSVERILMDGKFFKPAKAFILYRDKHATMRETETRKLFESIVNVEKNDVTRDNANMNADTPAGMMMKFSAETTKPFVDKYILSDEVKEAVDNNYIHIHDKDYYLTKSFTCLQHPLDRIFESGFRIGHGEARAPKRIETAAMLAVISLESIQNEMHGGQAIPAFDFYMAPYVRTTFIEEVKKLEEFTKKDYKHLYNAVINDFVEMSTKDYVGENEHIIRTAVNATVKRVHQAMESFIHNCNTIHSRGGNQVTFSSINYGTDTSAEGRCIIRELLKSTYQGVGNGCTAVFPIQIMKVKAGVNLNPGDPNYDLYKYSWKVTARRFFPNYLNLDASYNKDDAWDINDSKRYEHEVATMGCRTRVYENINGPKTSIGRGNLSFTTINLVKIALENKDLKTFWSKLEYYVNLSIKQLKERYNFQKTALKKQFPLLMSGMWNDSENLNVNETVESVIYQGTLGVGFIGLAEALIVLTGKHHGESEEAQKLGLEIVSYIKNIVDLAKVSSRLNYAVLATPAEGLAGKFTLKDRKQFGIIERVTDKDYYTNSNHVPVYYKCTPSHKATIEGPYHKLTLGGHIFYVEADSDITKNPEAVDAIVRLGIKNDCGYISVNHFQARCPRCNFEANDKFTKECPYCHIGMDILQRITGYLVGCTDRWNSGKLAELKDRVVHDN